MKSTYSVLFVYISPPLLDRELVSAQLFQETNAKMKLVMQETSREK